MPAFCFTKTVDKKKNKGRKRMIVNLNKIKSYNVQLTMEEIEEALAQYVLEKVDKDIQFTDYEVEFNVYENDITGESEVSVDVIFIKDEPTEDEIEHAIAAGIELGVELAKGGSNG